MNHSMKNTEDTLTSNERTERELEQRTRELLQQREWFQVTLSSIGDAVITTDVRGIVTFLNPVAESMTGWKREEAIGQLLTDVFNIINEYSRLPVENPIERVLQTGPHRGAGQSYGPDRPRRYGSRRGGQCGAYSRLRRQRQRRRYGLS